MSVQKKRGFMVKIKVLLMSVCHVFFDNCLHLFPFIFHIGNQFKLSAGAIQIVLWPVNLKIRVTAEVIGQKTHAAFVGHDFCTKRKGGNFIVCQAAAAAFQKALHIGFI